MVINPVAALPGTFLRRGEVPDITVIVITPHQGDILRHLKPCTVDLQHLFVGNEHLRHRRHVGIHVLPQQIPLVADDPLQHGLLFVHGLGSLHLPVVHATHPDSIEDFLPGHFFHTLFPEIAHCRMVAYIVIISFPSPTPFPGRTGCHRFTVRTTDINSEPPGHLTVPVRQEEWLGAFVHGRPIEVGPQAQEQLKNALVRARPDAPFLMPRFVTGAAPRHQSPILVIDEDAPIFHGRELQITVARRQFKVRTSLGSGIRPPFPR